MFAYLQLARPPQWIKNVFVFAGLLFGGTILIERGTFLASVQTALLAFVAFCLASSACYTFNDLLDRKEDQLHPVKRNRPIARGDVSAGGAVLFAFLLAAAAIGLAATVGRGFLLLLLTYTVLIVVYSLALKRLIILDVITISIGFVLRAWAGGVAVDVDVSSWLIVCTFTLCLFLGFGKRRCELATLGDNQTAKDHRMTLEYYSIELLNHLISVSAAITVVTFMLYTMDDQTEDKFGTQYLVYTSPLVIYAVFRYAMLIESGRITGPSDILLSDRAFLVVALLWLVVAVGIIYKGKDLQNWLESPRPAAVVAPHRAPPPSDSAQVRQLTNPTVFLQ